MNNAATNLTAEEIKMLDRFAENTARGWVVDPDGRRTLFTTAAEALEEIDWLLEATDIAEDY